MAVAPTIVLDRLAPDQPVTAATLATHTTRRTEQPPPIPEARIGLGRTRKVALIGSAESIDFAPWHDPSWEIWCHATCWTLAPRADRYFDQHPWDWIVGKNSRGYMAWLKANRVPIYMAERRGKDVPASIRYPLERLQSEFPYPFGSHAAFMTALALTEGVTHLGYFGIHYTIRTEYEEQRANAEFWAGLAAGRGVQLVIPAASPFCHEPRQTYAYQTHVGPDAQKRWQRKATATMDAHVGPVALTITNDVETLAANVRPEMIDPKNVDNLRRQIEGLPPLLPNGQPAW